MHRAIKENVQKYYKNCTRINSAQKIHLCIHFCLVRVLANQIQVRYDPVGELLPTDSSFENIKQQTQQNNST